jgi:hypothetical protein
MLVYKTEFFGITILVQSSVTDIDHYIRSILMAQVKEGGMCA